ncbi:MAG: SGNH/GDSL hydrolase family protein, partial [Thermomicrobiales bacterium]|nr:SGNH/GDSL hydrolase family protein [Thermomicrobiales bacterium]
YGDSNTWGYDPETGNRFPPSVRWTGVLARELGDGYRVIEEGLNGRTTRWDDPLEPGRNGLTYLGPCLASHAPLDMVLIMLGTNDLKQRFGLNASDIAQSAAGLAEIARRVTQTVDGRPAPVLLIAPPAVTTLTALDQMFAGAEEKSRLFSRYYRQAAAWQGVRFFDAGAVIVSSDLDGIHFAADQHRILGQALAGEVRAAFA